MLKTPNQFPWSTQPGNLLITDEEWKEISAFASLSAREAQVCRLLFNGMNRTEIGESLRLKFSTVRQYAEQLHVKLRVNSRVHLVLRIILIRDHLKLVSTGVERSEEEAK